jgi:hypothetical protein
LGEMPQRDEEIIKKRDLKQKHKEMALKEKYEREMERQKARKVSNSSFLTPEAALYLNDLVREKQ